MKKSPWGQDMSRIQEGIAGPFLGGELFKQDLLAGLFITGKSDDKMWVFHPVTPEI